MLVFSLRIIGISAHPINSGGRKKKISLHHGKFNVRVFGKLYAAIQYIVSFYNSKSRNLMWIFVGIP